MPKSRLARFPVGNKLSSIWPAPTCTDGCLRIRRAFSITIIQSNLLKITFVPKMPFSFSFRFYGLDQLNDEELTAFLSTIVNNCLTELCASFCIVPDEVARIHLPAEHSANFCHLLRK